ncbi:MAG: hypothetical protein GVY06_02370 [Alphaproteobacteria bacterium]|nr:hypothetical protein [Alphaproteobacteria bacterium]
MARLSIFAAGLMISACSGSSVGQGTEKPSQPADAALETYRDFLEARESASELSELYDFLPSRSVKMLSEASPAQLEMMGKSVLSPPNAATLTQPSGDFSLLGVETDGNEMTLILEAVSVSGGVRDSLRREIDMIRESDGWKVDDPRPKSWRGSARMPAEMPRGVAFEGKGAGASDWAATAPSSESLTLVAETSFPMRQSANVNQLFWDPNGHIIAVGSRERFNFMSLPDLADVWAVEANSPHFANTISADGATLMQGEKALPLHANLEASTTPDAFFFVKPVFKGVVAERGSMPGFSGYQFNPRRPVLALAAGEKIYFQPAEPAFWSADGPSGDIETWTADGKPTQLAWSGDGDRIAWLNGFREPGAVISVRSYPDGEVIQTLSGEDILPGPLFFGPEGRYLATTGGDGEQAAAFVWDLESGDLVQILSGVRHVAFAGDGKTLLAVRAGGMSIEAGVNDTIMIWKLGASEPEDAFAAFPPGDDGGTPSITAMETSPNGRYLAAVAEPGNQRGDQRVRSVRLWDLAGQ